MTISPIQNPATFRIGVRSEKHCIPNKGKMGMKRFCKKPAVQIVCLVLGSTKIKTQKTKSAINWQPRQGEETEHKKLPLTIKRN